MTGKKYVLRNYELADTVVKKAKGIMFRKKVARPLLFLFGRESIVSIHSFFCPRFDAVFLDKHHKAVDLHRNIMSNRVMSSARPAKYLVEFPPGSIRRLKLRKGTIIKPER